MKSLLVVVVVFFLACLQKKPFLDGDSNVYMVDYKLEYNIMYPEDSTKKHSIVYYINSKANNFFAVVIHYQGEINVYFTDLNGKTFSKEATHKELALMEKNGIVQTFSEFANPYKDQIDNYDFFSEGNTVINNYHCSEYLLRSTKPKLEKRKKLAHQLYFIDTTKSFVPMLIHPIAYGAWKSRKSIPDGLVVQKDDYNFKNVLILSEKLVSVTPVNFKITLIENN